MPLNQFSRRYALILAVFTSLLALCLAACTTPTETSQGETAVATTNPEPEEVAVEESEPSQPDPTATTPTPTQTPQPTQTPTAKPTLMPDLAMSQEIQESEALQFQYQRFIDYLLAASQEDAANFSFEADTRFGWEIHRTGTNPELWLKVISGQIAYYGQPYQAEAWLFFENDESEEPLLVVLQEAQQALDLAEVGITIDHLEPDEETGLPTAVNTDGTVLVMLNSELAWEINPELKEPVMAPATVQTRLVSTIDLSEDQSTIVRHLIYPNGLPDPDVISIGPPSPPYTEFDWNLYAQNLLSEADFYVAMRLYCGLDVEIASRPLAEAPQGWIDVCFHYLGTHIVDFGEYGQEALVVLQTFGEIDSQVVPIVSMESFNNPYVLEHFYYLDETGEVKSHSPVSVESSIRNRIAQAPGGMFILQISIGLANSPATPFIHSVLMPDGSRPVENFAIPMNELLGTPVISSLPIGAVLAQVPSQ